MPKKGGMTYAELQRWLKTLSPAQLAAPVLITPGADDFGGTEYVFVEAAVDVAREHATISGGYEGPVLLVKELVGDPSAAEVKEARSYAEFLREQE